MKFEIITCHLKCVKLWVWNCSSQHFVAINNTCAIFHFSTANWWFWVFYDYKKIHTDRWTENIHLRPMCIIVKHFCLDPRHKAPKGDQRVVYLKPCILVFKIKKLVKLIRGITNYLLYILPRPIYDMFLGVWRVEGWLWEEGVNEASGRAFPLIWFNIHIYFLRLSLFLSFDLFTFFIS